MEAIASGDQIRKLSTRSVSLFGKLRANSISLIQPERFARKSQYHSPMAPPQVSQSLVKRRPSHSETNPCAFAPRREIHPSKTNATKTAGETAVSAADQSEKTNNNHPNDNPGR